MDFQKLPKVELHCHLDGSLRPETVIEIAKEENIEIPSYEIEHVKNMLIAPMECKSLVEYLERFKIPVAVMQSKNSLRRVSYELLEDAAKENVKYIEVRFGPLLHTEKGLSIEEVIESVLAGIKDAENKFDIKGNLILGCLRNMPVDTVFDIIESGKNFIKQGAIAVDLCANEDPGFCEKYIEPIKLAREYGYRITIHAGETGVGENVFDAINMLGAERIGHGVFIKNCKAAYDIVKNKRIPLEMCPTSNIQTKAVNSIKNHPIYDFYKDGIKVTVNTDNRTVSNTTLNKEYETLFKEFNMDYDDYKQLYLNSIDASFAGSDTKIKLKKLI
ncbi:adenine deaminase [Clostridium acetireducens DSM 10703]|jgi:adenosine deaminase|uniref:Adenosine deaminase n=1 Tax=Clostridium acetireducens DSM 10703 TaxID=1121290 RepID=A0A1E8F2L7_9CLOT|nr:adenosine deaminase [Clostridium acetireducens]OFI07781.1 adenine deaminase [Clostridium acetireducens DSM 10703]